MREFSAPELKTYLESCAEAPLLLDVRQPWEFDICKINNSELIPMAQIPDKIETLDPTRETVVICHHGIRSRRVGFYLEQAGFNNIINLSGGVAQWAQTVDPQMPTY
ncbi:MAG: rhodanese-like domain-containing protein [Gammaproteobacteria bacterium]|nr:rhodanese-like domain-containing protein [Gammaproteobacteria bacterium]